MASQIFKSLVVSVFVCPWHWYNEVRSSNLLISWGRIFHGMTPRFCYANISTGVEDCSLLTEGYWFVSKPAVMELYPVSFSFDSAMLFLGAVSLCTEWVVVDLWRWDIRKLLDNLCNLFSVIRVSGFGILQIETVSKDPVVSCGCFDPVSDTIGWSDVFSKWLWDLAEWDCVEDPVVGCGCFDLVSDTVVSTSVSSPCLILKNNYVGPKKKEKNVYIRQNHSKMHLFPIKLWRK